MILYFLAHARFMIQRDQCIGLLHFLSIQGGGVDGLLQGVLNQKFPGPNNMENYMGYNCRSFQGHCFKKKTEFPGAI